MYFLRLFLKKKRFFFKTWQERDAYCGLVTGHASYCWDWGRYEIDGVEIGHLRIGYGNTAEQIGPDTYKVIRYHLVLRFNPCPPNTWLNPDTGQCISFSLGVPESNSPPFCPAGGAPNFAGNPIALGNGTKFQKETDFTGMGNGGILFERYYSNLKGGYTWVNNFSKRLSLVIKPLPYYPLKKTSDPYPSEGDACANGWAQIQNGLTDSWAKNSTTIYQNGKCNVVRNGVVVNTLPIIQSSDFIMVEDIPSVQVSHPLESFFFQYDSLQKKHVTINGALGSIEKQTGTTPRWKYTTASGAIELYSEDGKLLSITDKTVEQSLIYDSVSGLLSRVQDSTGHSLNFTYVNNQLASVTTDDNKTTSYTYNTLGLITDVKRPDNTHRLYHYEDSRFPTYLTGITDERGVRYATWQYDAQGRAISSEHAGGAEKTSLTFNADGSTTVTNALNKQTIYRFDDVAGARRVVKVEGQPTANCAGANQNYTYTDEGWLASKTDWKGNKTTYAYNAKGQETSRTEAYGTPVAKTITTEWHPTLNLKTKVTEPDKETTYTYDQNGLLTGQKTRSIAAQ